MRSTFILTLFIILAILMPRPALNQDTEPEIPHLYAKDLQFSDGEPETLFGESATGIGDINDDGFGDFVVGGRMWGGWQGKVYIYYGSENGFQNTEPSTSVIGEPNIRGDGVCIGQQSMPAGDINGDGIDDWITAGPGSWGGWTHGTTYIFYGGNRTIPNEADSGIYSNSSINSVNDYDWQGESASFMKDFNGDGYGDLFLGAPSTNYEPEPGDTGFLKDPYKIPKGYVYFGSENGLSTHYNVTFNDYVDDAGFALVASGDGDVNGDGLSDVLIAGYSYQQTGRAYLFFGSSEGNESRYPDVIINAPENSIRFSFNVAIINDLNGDGIDEVAIQSFKNQVSLPSYVALYLGNTENIFDTPDYIFETGEQRDNLGYSMVSIGDRNHDGYNDMAISAPGEADKDYEGYVYVFHGGETLDTNPDFLYIGENSRDQFGYSIGTVDLMQNGTKTLLFTSLGYNNNTGRLYLDMSIHINESAISSGFTFTSILIFFPVVMVISFNFRKRRKMI